MVAIPARRLRRRRDKSGNVFADYLATDALGRALDRTAATQLGTLGSGNHFLELQSDEDGALWLMVHSGLRAFGPAVRAHHTKGARPLGGGLRCLEASSPEGQAYLRDHEVALRFADINRRAILEQAVDCLNAEIGVNADWTSLVRCVHNHVRRERHAGEDVWVHRKGAISAREARGTRAGLRRRHERSSAVQPRPMTPTFQTNASRRKQAASGRLPFRRLFRYPTAVRQNGVSAKSHSRPYKVEVIDAAGRRVEEFGA